MGKPLSLYYGARSGTIAEQLKSQGFPFDPEDAARWERVRVAIGLLGFGGYIQDSQVAKARRILHNRIAAKLSDVLQELR